MKRNVFKPLLMLCFSMMYFLNLSGQNTWGNDSAVNPIYYDYAQILPHNPGPTDSVYLEYSYVSSDACPDFHLVKDSVDKNSVYVLKLDILAQGSICAEVVTKFKTKLFLGIFNEKTDVYLDGDLIATFDPYSCNMDKIGKVIAVLEKSSIIQEENSVEMYEIRDVLLKEGTIVKFHGTLIQCITTPCYNIVDCYSIIDVTDCVMDKIGVVVAGEGECADQLFVQEESGDSTKIVLYGIMNNNFEEIPLNSMPYEGLKIGDKIKFSARPLKNEIASDTTFCTISGVVECFELLTPYKECIIDKKGIVVQGKNLCEGQLFIKELTTDYSPPKLYMIIPNGVVNEDGMYIMPLKEGDKVAFGSIPFVSDTIFTGMNDTSYIPPVTECAIVGFATCYELTEAAETFSLSGKAIAKNAIIQSGSAVLFANGIKKALNAVALNKDGTFSFTDLIPGDYTVRVIPDFTLYKSLVPTFYVNKLRFKKADYISLKSSIDTITVQLRTNHRKVGNGKIYGNIFYESTGLKDTVLAENGVKNYKPISEHNYANNLPVILFDSDNQPVEWTLTDEFGNYKFDNLAITSYMIVSETAGAEAEIPVDLTVDNVIVNVNLMLKNSDINTDVPTPKSTNINMYPNPVRDNLTIYLNDNEMVNVFNATGQLCLQQQAYTGTNVLDLRNLNNGLYFIQIGKNKSKLIKK